MGLVDERKLKYKDGGGVRDVLAVGGIITPTLCPLCNNASESIIHMLRDCPHFRLFWDSLAIPIQPNLFYGSNLEVWLRVNCVSQQKSFSGLNWVRDVLAARGIVTPTLCPLCNNASESIIHMLRDCPHFRLFWDSLAIPIQPNLFYGSNLEVWLRVNCVSQHKSFSGLNWGTVFPFGVWSLEFMALAQ
ncbi:hypothetical protein CFP56_012948 [Quercus suber]|uniref:Reverse transcriptase zinc-binding domain-containing protein n=1 Tax=Quercus suber TaxID=58331 RepID=A0AAW0KWU0_QUESU